MREESDEVCDEAETVHSERIVVLCAMQELRWSKSWATVSYAISAEHTRGAASMRMKRP